MYKKGMAISPFKTLLGVLALSLCLIFVRFFGYSRTDLVIAQVLEDPNQDSDNDGVPDYIEAGKDQDKDKDGLKDWEDSDTCTMLTASGETYITFQLIFMEKEDGSDTLTQIEDQTALRFSGCKALFPEDSDITPPFGAYPYDLWRLHVDIDSAAFDPNKDYIFLDIYFEGTVDPLNGRYCKQEYDTTDEEAEWRSSALSGSFFIEGDERFIEIALSDARYTALDEIVFGLGDKDPNQWRIDHIGGVLWSIPGKGRCFLGDEGYK